LFIIPAFSTINFVTLCTLQQKDFKHIYVRIFFTKRSKDYGTRHLTNATCLLSRCSAFKTIQKCAINKNISNKSMLLLPFYRPPLLCEFSRPLMQACACCAPRTRKAGHVCAMHFLVGMESQRMELQQDEQLLPLQANNTAQLKCSF